MDAAVSSRWILSRQRPKQKRYMKREERKVQRSNTGRLYSEYTRENQMDTSARQRSSGAIENGGSTAILEKGGYVGR